MPEKYAERYEAYEALFSYFKGGRFLPSPLVNLSLSHLLSTEFIIGHISSVPLKKQKKLIRAVLLGSISEMLFSKDPDSFAVCDSAVSFVKKKGLSGLSGFVNAVTRRAAREREALRKEIEGSEDPRIRLSLPKPVFSSLEKDYGKKKAELIGRAFFKRRFTHLFIPGLIEEPERTIASLSKKGFVLQKDDSPLSSFYLERSLDGNSIIGSEEFKKGLIYLIDRSSLMPAESFLAIKNCLPGKPAVLDLCAAPGGKSVVAAALTHDSANIVSCDVSEEKTALIRENTERLHLSSIKPAVNDASRFNPEFSGRFDLVLCDVPCSGLGVIGRKPGIRYRHTVESFQSIVSLQKEIAKNACAYLRPGGILIYSTCTLRKAENEDMVSFIGESAPGIEVLSGGTRFPDEGDFDGFFTAVLKTRSFP